MISFFVYILKLLINLFLVFQFIRNQLLYEFAYIFYVILIVLIIVTFFMPIIKNSTRWIVIGSFHFQPSEVGKIIIIDGRTRSVAVYCSHIGLIPAA